MSDNVLGKVMHMKKIFAIIATMILMTSSCFAAGNGGVSNLDNPVAVVATSMGEIRIELFMDKAPKTVQNFIDLASDNFYDGTIFHRVIDGFMIQGGDPTGTGRGGPGYEIPDEFGEGLAHDSEGILSMANAGPITLAPTPWLNGHHAIFGKVIEGMDVVHNIGRVPTGYNDRPIVDIKIEGIKLLNLPDAK